ncbi:MAG: N-acetyltransferase [Flavobacteriales bacterium TMED84]|nr:MAG: N-acetyltransferase [Flavobacteriales bacterium TMED84]|tara:strand:+ start:13033 stop:13422 length:390 start_codon:yes stop_codon:yes gene_type:complete
MKIEIIEVDKCTVIFLAISNSKVIGKCSFKIRANKTIRYFDAYISTKHRNKGIYNSLFKRRQKFIENNFPNWKIESYCKSSTIELFKNNGFEIIENLYLVSKKSVFINDSLNSKKININKKLKLRDTLK